MDTDNIDWLWETARGLVTSSGDSILQVPLEIWKGLAALSIGGVLVIAVVLWVTRRGCSLPVFGPSTREKFKPFKLKPGQVLNNCRTDKILNRLIRQIQDEAYNPNIILSLPGSHQTAAAIKDKIVLGKSKKKPLYFEVDIKVTGGKSLSIDPFTLPKLAKEAGGSVPPVVDDDAASTNSNKELSILLVSEWNQGQTKGIGWSPQGLKGEVEGWLEAEGYSIKESKIAVLIAIHNRQKTAGQGLLNAQSEFQPTPKADFCGAAIKKSSKTPYNVKITMSPSEDARPSPITTQI